MSKSNDMQNCRCDCATTSCCDSKNEFNEQHTRSLNIDLLYLDLNTCEPCRETEKVLDEAITEVSKPLNEMAISINTNKIYVENEVQARELGLVTSPTIRINGSDIQLDFKESYCQSCSDIAGETIYCRNWIYQGKEYSTPPKGMIIEAVLKYVFLGPSHDRTDHEKRADVPQNIKDFFIGKSKKENSCCTSESSCCEGINIISNIEEKRIIIDYNKCTWENGKCECKGSSCDCGCNSQACTGCAEACPVNAIVREEIVKVDETKCIKCGACIEACPNHAISLC